MTLKSFSGEMRCRSTRRRSLGLQAVRRARNGAVLARDWTDHPLGQPAKWPEGLKVALSLVVNSPASMILCCSPQLHCFFNDSYIPLLVLEWCRSAW